MRIAYFEKQVAQNGIPILAAFIEGCRALKITMIPNSMDCDAAVIWSMVWNGRMKSNQQVYQYYRAQNKPVFVLEVGMIHRDKTWKVGVNNVNGSATWVEPFDPKRPNKLCLIAKPWKTRGRDIVIMGQRLDSGQWDVQDPVAWYCHVIDTVAQYSDRPIVFRPHPRFPIELQRPLQIQLPKRLTNTYDGFDFDNGIRTAWAVINYNSGPGSQAIVAGVPAFVDRSSLAAPLGNCDFTQIESPHRPDRSQWLSTISHTEWSVGEIAAGIPQKKLLDREIFHTG